MQTSIACNELATQVTNLRSSASLEPNQILTKDDIFTLQAIEKEAAASKKKKRCIKCRRSESRTTHHIFPKRFFGNGNINKLTFEVCRPCHDEIERLIPFQERPKSFYIRIVWQWLLSNGHGN
ncbi:MAG: hypothetical protein V1845_01155 [bacterium]